MVGKLDNKRTLLSQQSKIIIIVDVHLEVHQTIQSHVQLEMPHVCVCVCWWLTVSDVTWYITSEEDCRLSHPLNLFLHQMLAPSTENRGKGGGREREGERERERRIMTKRDHTMQHIRPTTYIFHYSPCPWSADQITAILQWTQPAQTPPHTHTYGHWLTACRFPNSLYQSMRGTCSQPLAPRRNLL